MHLLATKQVLQPAPERTQLHLSHQIVQVLEATRPVAVDAPATTPSVAAPHPAVVPSPAITVREARNVKNVASEFAFATFPTLRLPLPLHIDLHLVRKTKIAGSHRHRARR